MIKQLYFVYKAATDTSQEELEGPFVNWAQTCMVIQLKDPDGTQGWQILESDITLTTSSREISYVGLPETFSQIFQQISSTLENQPPVPDIVIEGVSYYNTGTETTSTSTTTETTTSTTTST